MDKTQTVDSVTSPTATDTVTSVAPETPVAPAPVVPETPVAPKAKRGRPKGSKTVKTEKAPKAPKVKKVKAAKKAKVVTGKGKHGHRRGRPLLYTKAVVKALLREAREKEISVRALCDKKGIKAISVNVAKARYGLTKSRSVKKVANA